jgi:predicted AAA+ superfamily ATPase
VITGSSAKIMGEELATLLTGRTLTVEIFTLSFKEFLMFKNLKLEDKFELIKKEEKIRKLLKEYILFGGFPEIVLQSDKEVKLKILSSYYQDILNKDIVKRFNVRRIDKLERIAFFYLTNFSSLITFNRIGKFLKLSEKSVEIYSKCIESSKLIFFLKRFSSSIKEQENSPRKVYLMDVGFHNLSNVLFSDKISKIYENVVAIKLIKNYGNIFYWKDYTGKEVDFVIKEGLKIKLIQVCYNLENKETKEREIKGLLKAMDEFKLKEGFIIDDEYEGEDEIKGKKINYVPLWRWLLN